LNRGKQRKAGRLWARVALAAAVLVALALPLGAGSAMGSAPGVVPLAAGEQCISGDPTWCLTVRVSPTSSGTVAVDDCVTDGSGPQGRCPSGKVNRNPNYPATCPTNSYCSKGGLGILAGDIVVLTAIPASGWAFSRWSSSSGDTVCTNAGNPCTFTMPAHGTMTTPVSITANFVQLWQLSVTVSPSGGGTVTDNPPGKISCPSTCTASYPNNTQVTLTATPSSGYRFDHWSASACSGTGTCTVTMNAAMSVTATFVGISTLTITVSGGGSVSYTPVGNGSGACTTTCVVQYDTGTTSVTLTASNGSDVFTGWGGDCASSGTQSSCTLTMDAAKNVTANFGPLFKLTLAVTGNGSVTYSPAGNGTGSCSSSCTVQFVQNTGVTLTAVDGTDSFDTWGGNCAGKQKTCAVTMDANKSVSASFTTLIITGPRFELTVGVTGSGKVRTSGIDCQPACQTDYSAGTSLTLTAVPDSGINFQKWDGDCASFGTQETCTLLMDNDKNVTASFSTNPVIGDVPLCSTGRHPCDENQLPEKTQSLVVSVSGADHGKVTGGPSGGLAPASAQDTPPPIACGSSSYVCYGDYTPGQTLKLQAKPAEGFEFTGWTGACKGRQTSCTLTVSELKRVTATFAPTGKRKKRELTMKVPTLRRVQWKASIGSGRLIVTGNISGRALLLVDLRGRHAGKLLRKPTRQLVKKAGPFRIVQPLKKRFFPKGTVLLPGEKVVSIRGKAPGFYVPMQVQTIPMRGPHEGVVRRSFTSATPAGRNAPSLPAGTKTAWANFLFEQQPEKAFGLRVYWYWPGGNRLLGSVAKANRHIVSSFLRSAAPLPSGRWRADLWAINGSKSKLVKRQYVQIG
jgi:hypothetical protein